MDQFVCLSVVWLSISSRNGYRVITSGHHVTSQGLPNVTTLEPSGHIRAGNQEEGLYEAMQRQKKRAREFSER